MYRYFHIGFIDSMLKDQSLLEYTYLFFPNRSKNNEKIVLTRIWVGFLGLCFVLVVVWGAEWIKLNQIPKTRKNYATKLKFIHKYTQKCSFRKYTF